MKILVTGLGRPVFVDVDEEGTLYDVKISIAEALGVDPSEIHASSIVLDSDELVIDSPLFHSRSIDVFISAGAGLPWLALYKNNPRGSPGTGEPPEQLMPTHLPWRFLKPLGSFDYHSVRRGLQVYEEVMAPCHSLKVIPFRIFQDFMTKEDAMEFASRFEVIDKDPDEQGRPVKRPAVLSDRIPPPFPNENAAKFANNGALPPDLSTIIFGRHHGADYIFHLLTGYKKPLCHGRPEQEGVWWNPYMPGGYIAMPPPLSDDMLEYGDGTPCTIYQMAKDVVHFLAFCTYVQHDWHKVCSISVFLHSSYSGGNSLALLHSVHLCFGMHPYNIIDVSRLLPNGGNLQCACFHVPSSLND